MDTLSSFIFNFTGNNSIKIKLPFACCSINLASSDLSNIPSSPNFTLRTLSSFSVDFKLFACKNFWHYLHIIENNANCSLPQALIITKLKLVHIDEKKKEAVVIPLNLCDL